MRIAEAREGGEIDLVAAAAGFCKTTLVVDWLSGIERPVSWLSLDEGDNDPVRFWTYLIAAVQVIERPGRRSLKRRLRFNFTPFSRKTM